MGKYLVTCACGRQIAVEPGQAGETLACDCGATVSVPTLRQLRQLPPAVEEGARPARAWGARQGAISACVIVAVACLLVAAASRYSQPVVPTFNPALRAQTVERGLAGLTPAGAWRMWLDTYEPLAARGMTEFKPPGVVEIERQIEWHRLLQMAMGVLAAVALVAAAIVGVTKTGRQGDKETRRV